MLNAASLSSATAPLRRSIMREPSPSWRGRNIYKRCEADFEEWREDAAFHAAKYARWDRKGERGI